jgi:hypothetical protein
MRGGDGTGLNWRRKEPKQETIQRLIELWELYIKPDLEKARDAFTDDQTREKITAFLDVTESRVMARIVLHAVPPIVNEKPRLETP